MCQIGNIYWDGAVGVAKDTDQALAWYRKAAALEEPVAEGWLADTRVQNWPERPQGPATLALIVGAAVGGALSKTGGIRA